MLAYFWRMKTTFHFSLFTALALFLLPASAVHAQNGAATPLPFDVFKVYPPFTITRGEIEQATALPDLIVQYPSSWVRSYQLVEVSTYHRGIRRVATNYSDTLTAQQRQNMLDADPQTGIHVRIRYIPENSLKKNDPKELTYTLHLDTEVDASFPGGRQKMLDYFQKKAIDHIPPGVFKDYAASIITFTVNEQGHISDAQIFWPSQNEQVDKLLLDAVCNMPAWQPARFANGSTTSQEFALIVGSMENCAINTVNIRRK